MQSKLALAVPVPRQGPELCTACPRTVLVLFLASGGVRTRPMIGLSPLVTYTKGGKTSEQDQRQVSIWQWQLPTMD